MTSHIVIDPAAKKTIGFDWDDWAANEGTTLSSKTVTPSTGITVTGETVTGAKVTCMIAATQSGTVKCHAVFADGQEDEKTMVVTVADQ